MMDQSEMLQHVESALQCLSSTTQSSPWMIQQAQQALLQWEDRAPDAYVCCLIPLIGSVSISTNKDGVAGINIQEDTQKCNLRLAAILALKAAVARRWKDKGRGKIGGGNRRGQVDNPVGMNSGILLSDEVKNLVRHSILGLVITGQIATQMTHEKFSISHGMATNLDNFTPQQIQLLQDHPLQANASSLLSKIARMDLPLKFQELIPTLVEGVKITQGNIWQIQQQQHQHQQTQTRQLRVFETIQHNAMRALEAILAEMSTQRLLVDKKYRISIAQQHLGVLVEGGLIPSLNDLNSLNQFANTYNASQESLGRESDLMQIASSKVNYAMHTSRVISYLLISSLPKLVGENSSVTSTQEATWILTVVDNALSTYHSFLTQWLPGNQLNFSSKLPKDLNSQMNAILQVQCEMMLNLQKSHPMAFVKYLNPFLILFHSSLLSMISLKDISRAGRSIAESGCLSSQSIGVSHSNPLAITFLNFLANVTGTTQYMQSGPSPNHASEVLSINIWNDFFTPSLLVSLARTLLFLFSYHLVDYGDGNDEDADGEFVLWQDDPEGFYQWENNRTSEDDVGCAAQNLFLALVESSSMSSPSRCSSLTPSSSFSSEANPDSLSKSSHNGGREVILGWLIRLLTNIDSQKLAAEVERGTAAGTDSPTLMSSMPLGSDNLNPGDRLKIEKELVLQWEAIYTAAGLLSNILESYPGFKFHEWFEACLEPCLGMLLTENMSKETPVLRRRIVWLLSCCSHQVNISSPFDPLSMVSSIISQNTPSSQGSDICVRLTSVQTLEMLLPHCEDAPQLLHTIISTTIPALYQLANDCSEVESRSSCLNLVSTLVAYAAVTGKSLESNVLNSIVQPLSSIWNNSLDQNLLLKRDVLTILSGVASLVGPDQAVLLYPMALPMIDDSLAREENVFLVEEALKIWFVLLRLAKEYNSLLGKLFSHAESLSKDFEHVIVLMRIAEHYIMLGAGFLNDHAATLQIVFCNLVGQVKTRGVAYIALAIEALLRSYPQEGGSLLLNCGVLKKFLEACADSDEPDRVIVFYLTALARILLATPNILRSLLPFTLPSGLVFGEKELVSMYIEKFQVAGNGAHGLLFQKLWAMLLLSFYPPFEVAPFCNAALERSSDIFNIFCYIVKNVDSVGNSNVLSYDVGYDSEEETVDVGAEMYEMLLQTQTEKDTAFTTVFHEKVSSKLNRLPMVLGDSYQNFVRSIDAESLKQLQEALM